MLPSPSVMSCYNLSLECGKSAEAEESRLAIVDEGRMIIRVHGPSGLGGPGETLIPVH